jgi:hypothetical protein
MSIIADHKWYIIQTRSRFEKKCFNLLSLQGISVFLPTQKVKRKWSDRIKEIEIPLFSGYIFIQEMQEKCLTNSEIFFRKLLIQKANIKFILIYFTKIVKHLKALLLLNFICELLILAEKIYYFCNYESSFS